MINSNMIEDMTAFQSNYDDNRTKEAKVIPLFPNRTNSVTEQVGNTINYQTNSYRGDQLKQHRIRKDFRDKISFNQIRRKADNASRCITKRYVY